MFVKKGLSWEKIQDIDGHCGSAYCDITSQLQNPEDYLDSGHLRILVRSKLAASRCWNSVVEIDSLKVMVDA